MPSDLLTAEQVEQWGCRAPDELLRLENQKAGHTLCERCNGTGNEMYAMYSRCEACGGEGFTKRYGARSTPARAFLLWRERRQRERIARRPRDWNAEVRCWLSYWLGIGDWFHDRRDRCRRCDALPSDIDFALKRTGPRRAECIERDCCDECIAEMEVTNGK